jgi:hypothetical protein
VKKNTEARSNSKFYSPVVAIGLEKNVGQAVVRGEVEHRLRRSKVIHLDYGLAQFQGAMGVQSHAYLSEHVQLKSDAWTVRLSVVKHINMFRN